jgi:hypothetical protein
MIAPEQSFFIPSQFVTIHMQRRLITRLGHVLGFSIESRSIMMAPYKSTNFATFNADCFSKPLNCLANTPVDRYAPLLG